MYTIGGKTGKHTINKIRMRCGHSPNQCEYWAYGTCRYLKNGIANLEGIKYRSIFQIDDCELRPIEPTDGR